MLLMLLLCLQVTTSNGFVTVQRKFPFGLRNNQFVAYHSRQSDVTYIAKDSFKTLSKFVGVLQTMKEKEAREQMFLKVSAATNVIKSSVMDCSRNSSDLRDNIFFYMEVACATLVLFGMPQIGQALVALLGLVVSYFGLYLLLRGTWEYASNVASRTQTGGPTLITSGAYDLVRHPMYGGLILLFLGLSISAADSARLVMTLFIALLLVMYSIYEQVNPAFQTVTSNST